MKAQILIRAPASMKQQLVQAAKHEGLTLTALVIQIFKAWLNENKTNNKESA